jgi:hypothetical protein
MQRAQTISHNRVFMKSLRIATLGVMSAVCFGTADAQRPAPPKNWTLDTTSGRPVMTRKGGMLSTDARAELLGPVARENAGFGNSWLTEFARGNASTMGTVSSSQRDTVSVSRFGDQQVVVTSYTVATPQGNKYVAYGVLQSVPAGAPVIVMRSTFGDALTLVRTFKSSIEALLPFVVTPMDSMRVTQTVAMAATTPRSFRTASGPPVAGAAPDSAATPSDSVGSAVGSAIADAAALLGAPTDSVPPAPATTAAGGRRASTRGPNGAAATTATTGAAGAGGAPGQFARTENVHRVVFYQFGDLLYRPVALFKDGTSFDMDDEPIEQIDLARSRAEKRTQWGRWRNVGAKYFLTEGGNGHTADWELGTGFYTAFAAPSGTTLNATYKAVSGSSFGETSSLITTLLQFTPDGRFSTERSFAATGSGEITGVTMAAGSSSGAKQGRYRITAYTIELAYDDGRKKSYFFAFSSSGKPLVLDRDMIFLGDTPYVTDP